MQSWATFTTGDKGTRYYAILSSVNKSGHLYRTLQEKKSAVINFMSAAFFAKSMDTIKNNQYEVDEILESGLTPVAAEKVDAPMVDECFMKRKRTMPLPKESSKKRALCRQVKQAKIVRYLLAEKCRKRDNFQFVNQLSGKKVTVNGTVTYICK